MLLSKNHQTTQINNNNNNNNNLYFPPSMIQANKHLINKFQGTVTVGIYLVQGHTSSALVLELCLMHLMFDGGGTTAGYDPKVM